MRAVLAKTRFKKLRPWIWVLTVFVLTCGRAPGQLVWMAGADDGGWPAGDGGGINASFVQENGFINVLPGSPESTEVPFGADNDYYFAGSYTTDLPQNGQYAPVGDVIKDEEAAERAFAAADNDLRFHFNLPVTLQPADRFVVTFEPLILDDSAPDSRYGIYVLVNNVEVQPEIIIRPHHLNTGVSTAPFTLEATLLATGPGYDNIVSLRGRNYNNAGGGNWMGFDYVRMDRIPPAVPPPVFPWAVGNDDNNWTTGNGGGQHASFVQENGASNPLPGSAFSTEAPLGADDDYYFAGNYTTVIAGNGQYTPAGLVLQNEEAAERAFAATDNTLRYHFNLPATLQPADLLSVTFDALNLDPPGGLNTDSRYGVEIYCNGVLVQPEILIRASQLDVDFTSPSFTLASVGAKAGPGFDNIITLRGINYNGAGGGNWMGIDYVRLNSATPLVLQAPVVSNGQVTLNWTGIGTLEWSSNLLVPWTPVNPAGTPPYSEPIAPGGRRYFRLRK